LIQINELVAIGVFNGGMMWPYHPDLLAKPVPRYTSYPPATSFRPDVGAAEQAEALNGIAPSTPISVYVHIPYCHSICWYCGCNTGLAGKRQRLTSYLEALETEIRSVARLLGGRGKVTRIALGGGSPNAIEPLAFVRLIDHLVTTFVAGEPSQASTASALACKVSMPTSRPPSVVSSRWR
jgi:oxygen-independent coproporphyrinogen III oxidase